MSAILLRAGLPLSAAACGTQVETLCTVTLNSQPSRLGLRPVWAISTIWSVEFHRARGLPGRSQDAFSYEGEVVREVGSPSSPDRVRV